MQSFARVLAGSTLALACSYDFQGFGTEAYEPPTCGNGKLEGVEQCDPGPGGPDAVNCTPECTLAVCGDSNVEANEECDLGASNADDATCTSACRLATCGDGLASAMEECDDGNDADEDACTSTCRTATCGDGIIQQDVEKCDDGPMNAIDGVCTPLCQKAVCGDGFIRDDAGEECDDKNFVDTDFCTSACKKAVCGDGIVGPGEVCDDGNAVDDDACSNMCAPPKCGNMTVEMGEECDDGNNDDLDGCRNTCLLPKCGDGILDQDEECDGDADPWFVCEECKLYLESVWTMNINSPKPIPDDHTPANINTPGIGSECASFTIPFSGWTKPDAATNAMYGFVHHIEFDVGIEHPDVGEIVIYIITFTNPSHLSVMRRPGMSEGAWCSDKPGGSGARLLPEHELHFAMTGACDPMDANDPDCLYRDPETIGDGLGDGDIVCNAEHPCDFYSSSGDFQPPVTLAALKGFDLAPGDPWGKPNWFLCVQDTVVNKSNGVLRSATVRTLRRKTAL